MKYVLSALAGLLFVHPLFAQEKQPVIAPYNYLNIRELYLDTVNHHTSMQMILREDTTDLYRNTDSVKRGWIYRKLLKEHLIEVRNNDFNAFIDFLPDWQVGRSFNHSKNLWTNTRGVGLQVNVGKKFYLESYFFENQAVLPVYLDSFVSRQGVVPGQGWPKITAIGKSYDFSYVNAMLAYTPNKYLQFVMGYGTNKIGDGYRSLLLSDIALSYPYLKITGTLGKVQYTSMWAKFIDFQSKDYAPEAFRELGYMKKWGVFHFLDWNISKKVTVGLFDAIIWPDSDTTGRKRGFDWSYMNPVIFLRPGEHSTGSSDNAMVGMNAKFKLWPTTTLYGQLMFDELKIKELLNGNGWWGNKWSSQLGFRSFDLFKVPKLDLQGELNIVRPYTYSFRNTRANFAHYSQSLAHPMGANFWEALGIASYTHKRWYIRGQLTFAKFGMDATPEENNGHDIFKLYQTRTKDFDNRIGQGVKTNFTYLQGSIAYVLNPKYNLRLELSGAMRSEKNDLATRKEYIVNFGLRSTFRQLYYDF